MPFFNAWSCICRNFIDKTVDRLAFANTNYRIRNLIAKTMRFDMGFVSKCNGYVLDVFATLPYR
jgi:hypothetical protein